MTVYGYVFRDPGLGRKPLYYAKNQQTGHFLYTADQSEYDGLDTSVYQKLNVNSYLMTQSGSATTIAQFTYDANSNVLTYTDANGLTTTNTYDDIDRLLTTKNHANETVSYGYDGVSCFGTGI